MIPKWNSAGILPPIRPGETGGGDDRSPYKVSLYQVIEHFATSPKRITILHGLLNYREQLHQCGIVSGFQWLDGSFMEQVELLDSRPPNDVDVVTFFHLPADMTQKSLAQSHRHLFDPRQTKTQFHVDGYACILGEPTTPYHVKQISYWYSMWSHRRDGTWKGFVQVDLAPKEDITAKPFLALILQNGGLP